MHTEGHILVKNDPRFLTVLLEAEVMPDWLDTMFLKILEPNMSQMSLRHSCNSAN